MLTYEKVLAAFKEYLEETSSCEVVNTSRGYIVMLWDSCLGRWYDFEITSTPEALRDVLLDNCESDLVYQMTGKGMYEEPTEREKQQIEAACRALLERCQ